MSESNELRDALRVAVPVEPEETVTKRRELLLSVIEREIYATPGRIEREQARRSWRRSGRILGVAAALVATLGLGMLVAEFEGGPGKTSLQSSSARKAADAKNSLREASVHLSLAGQNFETGAGHEKVLQMAGSTKVTLAAHTRVFIGQDSENQQHLNLMSGGLLLSVPADRKDRSVQVQTTHATVQVTGTVFGVEVGRFSQPANTPARTRVSVERGQVVVLHGAGRVVLAPGDTWLSPLELGIGDSARANSRTAQKSSAEEATEQPASAAQTRANSQEPSALSEARARRTTGSQNSTENRAGTAENRTGTAPLLVPERGRVVSSGTQEAEEPSTVHPSTVHSSTLAAQNNLLERALTAESRGNREQAQELIERFLQRYPRSPLRASALAIKKRLDSAE